MIKEGLIHEDISGHKNIVNVIKAGKDGDEYFLVSEFLKGERLDTFIATEAPITQKKAIDIILQLMEAEIAYYQERLPLSGYETGKCNNSTEWCCQVI